MKLAIKNLTRRPAAAIPFRAIAKKVLGANYDLSLALIGDARARRLNRRWRGRDKPANILSFPLDKNSGEIFLNLGRRSTNYLRFLFIHGLLHLKGLAHGSKMESLESQIVKYFQTHEQNDRRRARHRQRRRSGRRL
ncbi:MAG: rRNA maturation RNAse YbeY [Candidatus Vogelbacteria bacterium]|nr:rRNA maturation RNAse YbeY [Candidatus Vogelbacteria bacterium]